MKYKFAIHGFAFAPNEQLRHLTMFRGGSVDTATVALTALHTRNAVAEGATLSEWPTLPVLPLQLQY